MQKKYKFISSLLFLCLFLFSNMFSTTITSNGTGGGAYNTGSSWQGGVVPSNGDNIVIQAGDVITVDASPTLVDITISGTLRIGNDATARTITSSGTLTIHNGGTFDVGTASNTTHTFIYSGSSIANAGTLDFSTDANSLCDAQFTRNGNQTISGSGSTTDFNAISADLGSNINNILEFTCSNFTSSLSGFLSITSGTVKFSNSNTLSAVVYAADATIPAIGKLSMNSSTTTLAVEGTLTVNGAVEVNSGTLNVGYSAANKSLIVAGTLTQSGGTINCGDGSNESLLSDNGTFNISGGTLNIAGRFEHNTGSSTTNFTMSGGTMTCTTVSNTSSTAPFSITVTGSTFNMSGGTIVIQRSGASNSGIVITGASGSTVTAGIVQIGNASTPSSNTMLINVNVSIHNLTVNSANATAQLNTNNLDVNGNLSITAGTLDANNLNLNVGGNWSNSGTFTTGTGTVTFDGTSAQSISKSGGETFYNLAFSNAGTKTLGSAITGNGNLTINSNATVDVSSSNYAVTVKGNWSNSGTYTAQSGTVTLSGSSTQTISGSSITQFYTLSVSNSAGVNLGSAQNIKNLLNVSAGDFNTQGFTFTLLSTSSSQCARVGYLSSGTSNVIGNVTVQRTISTGNDGWHLLSSPVAGSTLNDWMDDFSTSGFPGSAAPGFSFVSINGYDETQLGTYDVGYTNPSGASDATGNGKGYWCYISPTPVTIDVTGTINKFTVSPTVTFTDDPAVNTATHDGWNLIGNPYPSTIDWEASTGLSLTNVENIFQIWNEASQQYEGWNANAHTGVNGRTSSLIPSSQAFYIQTNASSPSISFNENIKAAGSDESVLKLANGRVLNNNSTMSSYVQYPQFVLKLSGNNYKDETKLLFTPSATTAFDQGYDMSKFFSPTPGVPNITSLSAANDDLVLNVLPQHSTLSIPIKTLVQVTGTYTISAQQFINYPASVCLILEDKQLSATHNIRTGGDYTCTLYDTTHSARFVLHIGTALNSHVVQPLCIGSANGIAVSQGSGAGPFNYTWKSLAGSTLQSHNNTTGADSLYNLAAGTYIVTVSGNGGLCPQISDTIVITSPSPIVNTVSVSHVSCNGLHDGSVHITNTAGGHSPYTYHWNNNSSSTTLNNLGGGSVSLVTTDANACTHTDTFALHITYPVSAAFSFIQDTVYLSQAGQMSLSNYSSNATAYLWNYGDGSSTETTPDAVHTFTNTGTYIVTLVAYNGPCSDTATHSLHILVSPDSTTTGLAHTGNQLKDIWIDYNNQSSGPGLNFNFENENTVVVEIRNTAGQLISQENYTHIKQTKITLNTQPFSSGIYLLYCKYGNKVKSFKLMVGH